MYVNVVPLIFIEKGNRHSLQECLRGHSSFMNIGGLKKMGNYFFIYSTVQKVLIYSLIGIMNIDKILEGRDFTC